MPSGANAKRRPRTKPLYFSAKISDYHFKRVLWSFTLDRSAAEAAREMRLSANSITAIYGKLRKFFFDHGLFRDPYNGGDPRDGLAVEGYADIEHLMLAFHLKRVKEKHGSLDAPLKGPDHHFAESVWRFDYHNIKAERGPDLVHRMMYEHLMQFVRRFGPVGARGPIPARVYNQGLDLAFAQLDQVLLWLERNSVRFRVPEERAALRQLREL